MKILLGSSFMALHLLRSSPLRSIAEEKPLIDLNGLVRSLTSDGTYERALSTFNMTHAVSLVTFSSVLLIEAYHEWRNVVTNFRFLFPAMIAGSTALCTAAYYAVGAPYHYPFGVSAVCFTCSAVCSNLSD